MTPRSTPVLSVALLACSLAAAAPALADWPVDGTPVVTTTGIQGNFHAIADGAGGFYVAWDDSRSGLTDIYLQRLTRAGVPFPGWPATGAPVCTYSGTQTAARLCRDGAGGVFVAFVDQSAGTANADIRLQRVTGGGAIAAGWPLSSTSGVAVCMAVSRQYGIKAMEDGSGGVYLSWLDQRFGGGGTDVAFTRILADGSVAPGWPDNGVDPSFDLYVQEAQVMQPDGAGGLWVGWSDAHNSQYAPLYGYDVALTHFDPTGVAIVPYPGAGLLVTQILGSQNTPAMLPDGAGGMLFAFRDARNQPALDLYATRVDANCDVHAGWPDRDTGLPLSTATGDQDQPVAVSDGSGGAIVVWRDSRTNPTFRLYATRFTGAAAIAPGWATAAAGGTAVCDVAADQQQHAVLEDGAGGAFIVWRDQRNGGSDIYATRFKGDGVLSPTWPAAGVPVSTAANAQQTPQIVSDGAGGAFVVWSDLRNDSGDLYAAHLTPAGLASPTLDANTPPPSRVDLRLASPSPTNAGARFALALPRACVVRAMVLDAAGRRVRELSAGSLGAGMHSLPWDGLGDDGRPAGPGLYFVSVAAGDERRSVRLVVSR